MLNFNEIILLFKNKKYIEAIEHLEKLIQKDQDNIEYHFLKGTIHFNLDELNDAIKSFSNAIRINEKHYNMYYLRGAAYTSKNKYLEAEEDFKKAISIKEDFSEGYYGLGALYSKKKQNLIAIENYLKSINLKKNFNLPIIQLIKILTRTENVKETNSIIISKHNEINKFNANIKFDDCITDKNINDLIANLFKIIGSNFKDINFRETQIYRRNQFDLNCKRHKKIFNTYSVIPKFCFSCYKVQIEPKNVNDLIKLYLIFDNVVLKSNNTRKCMIEKRSNIEGNYKGLIYCNSLEEAKNIYNYMNELLYLNFNKKIKIKIKRGCSEYSEKFEKYNSFELDRLNYDDKWSHYENLIDKKFDHMKSVNEVIPTIKGLTLNDVLIINNWLSYARDINDKSIKF